MQKNDCREDCHVYLALIFERDSRVVVVSRPPLVGLPVIPYKEGIPVPVQVQNALRTTNLLTQIAIGFLGSYEDMGIERGVWNNLPAAFNVIRFSNFLGSPVGNGAMWEDFFLPNKYFDPTIDFAKSRLQKAVTAA